MKPFPVEWLRLGPLSITDTVLVTAGITVGLVLFSLVLPRLERVRSALEIAYEIVEHSVLETTGEAGRPLVPLVLTQWLFIGLANLVGIVPLLPSPTRDLSLTLALALIAFAAGHVYAFRAQGLSYLRQYIEPHWMLLPFNLIGEISRTLALALRLFGNMLSGTLITAIIVYLAGLLLPIPFMLLGVLTAVVQAYIFGVLTLVFAAGSMQAASSKTAKKKDVREEKS